MIAILVAATIGQSQLPVDEVFILPELRDALRLEELRRLDPKTRTRAIARLRYAEKRRAWARRLEAAKQKSRRRRSTSSRSPAAIAILSRMARQAWGIHTEGVRRAKRTLP